MPPNQVFTEFVTSVGGATAAARVLRLSYGMVDHILKGRRGVSKRVAEMVDTVTAGKFCKSELMFGRPADALPRKSLRKGDARTGRNPQAVRRTSAESTGQ